MLEALFGEFRSLSMKLVGFFKYVYYFEDFCLFSPQVCSSLLCHCLVLFRTVCDCRFGIRKNSSLRTLAPWKPSSVSFVDFAFTLFFSMICRLLTSVFLLFFFRFPVLLCIPEVFLRNSSRVGVWRQNHLSMLLFRTKFICLSGKVSIIAYVLSFPALIVYDLFLT